MSDRLDPEKLTNWAHAVADRFGGTPSEIEETITTLAEETGDYMTVAEELAGRLGGAATPKVVREQHPTTQRNGFEELADRIPDQGQTRNLVQEFYANYFDPKRSFQENWSDWNTYLEEIGATVGDVDEQDVEQIAGEE